MFSKMWLFVFALAVVTTVKPLTRKHSWKKTQATPVGESNASLLDKRQHSQNNLTIAAMLEERDALEKTVAKLDAQLKEHAEIAAMIKERDASKESIAKLEASPLRIDAQGNIGFKRQFQNETTAASLEAEFQAVITRLSGAFADMMTAQVNGLCDEAVNSSDEAADAMQEAELAEILEDCKRDDCDGNKANKCEVGRKWCGINRCAVCNTSELIKSRVEAGNLNVTDIVPKNATTLSRMQNRLGNIKDNVVGRVKALVEGICANRRVTLEITQFAKKFEEELCIMVGSLWVKRYDTRMAEAVAVFRAFEEGLGEGLSDIAKGSAAIVTNVLKFIFAPAKLIPRIGEAMHTMLESMADYIGERMEVNMRHFLQQRVNQFLQNIYSALPNTNTAGNNARSTNIQTALKQVFACTNTTLPQNIQNTITGAIR